MRLPAAFSILAEVPSVLSRSPLNTAAKTSMSADISSAVGALRSRTTTILDAQTPDFNR
jgi:hypothetical protein